MLYNEVAFKDTKELAMPDYVQHDSGTIVKRWRSVDPSIVEALDNIVLVTREVYNSLTKYHIVDGGTIREMSQAEKDVIIQAEADTQAQAIEDALQRYEVSNVELLTALIKRINVRIPNNPITKQEIITQIKADR